jgi:DNA polymerase-1
MLIDTEEKAAKAFLTLSLNPGAFTVDLETTGLDPYRAKDPALICGFAIGWADTEEHDTYWTFRHEETENLPLHWLEMLMDLLNKREVRGANIKFDIHMLLAAGWSGFPSRIKCSHICTHTGNENFQKYALKAVAEKVFGADAVMANTELMAELKKRKAGKEAIYKLPAALVTDYAIDDLRLHRKVLAHFEREVARWGMTDILEERYTFQTNLIRTEQRGLKVDVAEVEKQIGEIGPLMAHYKERLWELQKAAGYTTPVNINSPKQLREWLKLPKTAKDFLKEILQGGEREDIQTLLDYRTIQKCESTYYRPWLEMRDPADRLHTGYKINGTVTWRLSSSDPNLQNLNKKVKRCIIEDEGWFLAELDFSAVEPRIAAHYSGDPDMIAAFVNKIDFHSSVARNMFKISGKIEKESKERQDAKTLGLGVLYGLGSFRSAQKLGLRHAKLADGSWEYHGEQVWALDIATGQLIQKACSAQSAEYCTCLGKEYRKKFYTAVPQLEPNIKAVQATAKRNKYIRIPLFGTVQRFDGKRARNGWVKAYNSLIQHSAAIILMRAFNQLAAHLASSGPDAPQILGTVHDSIILRVKYGTAAHEHLKQARSIMENAVKLVVPLVVDVKVGYNLGNMGEVQC